MREAGSGSYFGDADLVEAALAEQLACGAQQFLAAFGAGFLRDRHPSPRAVVPDFNITPHRDLTLIVMFIMITNNHYEHNDYSLSDVSNTHSHGVERVWQIRSSSIVVVVAIAS